MITHLERRWLLGFTVFVLAITTIPYLAGFQGEMDAWEFTGFVFGVEDGNSYIAKMVSGFSGAWLFKTPYTAYPQRGVLAFLPYLLLGKLLSHPGLHDQAVGLFHIFRWIAGAFELAILYRFSTLFLERPAWRQFALALASLGGGLGWFLLVSGNRYWFDSLPLDFISPETFGFLGIYGLPHLALARGLLFYGLWVYLAPKECFPSQVSEARARAAGTAAWAGLVLVQPVTALVGWFVIAIHLGFGALRIWRARHPSPAIDKRVWIQHLKRGLFLIAASAPLVIYLGISYLTDPFLYAWEAQNRIISPHPFHYLAAYGWIAPLAVAGGVALFRQGTFQSQFLISWVVCLPVLAYAPINLQRRLPEGIWVALVILAVVAMQRVHRFSQVLRIGLLIVSIPSSLVLLTGGWESARQPSSPQFIPAAALEAYNYLSYQALPGSVVLASFRSGNELPAFAPVRVMIGHGPESANGAVLQEQIEQFFQSTTKDDTRQHLLQDFDVRYVLWGPHEKTMGDWNPDGAAYLNGVFTNQEFTIFQVSAP